MTRKEFLSYDIPDNILSISLICNDQRQTYISIEFHNKNREGFYILEEIQIPYTQDTQDVWREIQIKFWLDTYKETINYLVSNVRNLI